MKNPRSSPNITIHDVARRAGVALSSVSRVLNGHPAVSESMRERVLSAVAELDYQADFTASSLRRGSTMTVAFVVRDIASALFSDMVKAAETALAAQGYSVLLMNSDGDPAREAAHIRTLARSRVDGLILSLSSEADRDTLAALKSFRLPVVLIDRAVADIEASSVLSDHFAGVSAATKYLAEQGHSRIGLITGSRDVLASRERFRGYKAGLRSAGLKFDPDLVRMQSYAEAYGESQTTSLLEMREPVTAVIAGGGLLSYGALRALLAAEARGSAAVNLVACDPWRAPELFEPAVGIVQRDGGEMGTAAAALLLESIANKTHRSVTLPTEFVKPRRR